MIDRGRCYIQMKSCKEMFPTGVFYKLLCLVQVKSQSSLLGAIKRHVELFAGLKCAVSRADGFNKPSPELFRAPPGQNGRRRKDPSRRRPTSHLKGLTVAAGYPVHDEPPDVEHAGVVVDVEEGDLVIALPEYEEEGVHELDELGEVVPPQDVGDLRGGDATGDSLKETRSLWDTRPRPHS